MSVSKKTYRQSADKIHDELLHLYDDIYLPKPADPEQAWTRFLTALRARKQVTVQNTRSLKLFVSAAAGILLLIGLSVLFHLNKEVTISCRNAQNILTTLPDGSTVKLNASSYIKYKKSGWKKNRIVFLNGEAFFTVKKGRRFQVNTSNGKIVVMGTSFNVFSRQKNLSVVCKTGKVLVEASNSVILVPGMRAMLERNRTLKSEEANIEHATAWQHGEFWYNNVSLTDVFAEIERQFDVVIKCSGIENRKYSGYFNIQSLQNSLTGVCTPMQLHFKQESKKIFIIY